MTPVELVVLIIVMLLVVPEWCAQRGRPALAYTVYLLTGALIAPVLEHRVATLLYEIGTIGFVLLLFEVGLDIDLPRSKDWSRPLVLAARWLAVQYPLTFLLGVAAGLTPIQAGLAMVALNGCALSMSYAPWQTYAFTEESFRQNTLLWMVALEIIAMGGLTLGDLLLREGLGSSFLIRLFSVLLVIGFIASRAEWLMSILHRVLGGAKRWSLHYIVLYVLLLSALGARMGLSAAKTAFLLGLFVSRSTHEGLAISDHLRPIGQRLLIPIFFISLGASIPLESLLGIPLLFALGSAGFVLGIREILARRSKNPALIHSYLLTCPNLTLVAVASRTLDETGASTHVIAWVLSTGACVSVMSMIAMPARKSETSSAGSVKHS